MRESIGKATARKIFYEDCVQKWLPKSAIENGHALVLLGKDFLELPYLDAVGVERGHILSVEVKQEIFFEQMDRNLKQASGKRVSLFLGTMHLYLSQLLRHNQGCVILNLDIEGGYMNHLDKSMSEVLLLCWRFPETVLGIYHSVGRDVIQLQEGLKALTIILGLTGKPGYQLMQRLLGLYSKAGLPLQTGMQNLLRDCCWLWSTVEHQLIVSTMVGLLQPYKTKMIFESTQALWVRVRKLIHKKDTTLKQLFEIVDKDTSSFRQVKKLSTESLCCALQVKKLCHVYYQAQRPWSQLGYFVQLSSKEFDGSLSKLVLGQLNKLSQTLHFVNRTGKLKVVSGAGEPEFEIPVWYSNSVSKFEGRKLPIPYRSHGFSAQGKIGKIQRPTVTKAVTQGKVAAKKRLLYASGNELTTAGIDLIRKLAKSCKTLAELNDKLPTDARAQIYGVISNAKLRAHLAVAHRK